MSRVATPLKFINTDINQLNNVVNNELSSPEVVKRCKAILMAIGGNSNKSIAATLDIRENTVSDWRKVWQTGGINALLSISHTGRPRSEARKVVEKALERDTDKDYSSLIEETGASKSTIYRAVVEKSDSETVSVSITTSPRHVDICGLYISNSECAAILRVSAEELSLDNGEMWITGKKTAQIVDTARNIDGHIRLVDAMRVLTEHAAEVDKAVRRTEMQSFLASIIPALPDDCAGVYYVFFFSMNTDCVKPAVSRINMRTNRVANVDTWINETAFWISMLSKDDEIASEFADSTRAYINARSSDAEPFQWYRHDITPQNISVIEFNDFGDPSVNSVVIVTATIQNRDGTQSTVENKVTNAVPAAKDLQYTSALELGESLGALDVGLGDVFRQTQRQLMQSYIEASSKKKR